MAGNYRFAGNSTAAITQQGNISTATGGTVALIATKIVNEGSIAAPQGNVLMGAGQAVTLDLGGPVKLQVTQGALDAIIEQDGAIRADGGMIYLSAQAAGDLAAAVINHTGISEARSLSANDKGEIVLIGDMAHGTVNVGGTLDASAPNGGNGGFVETSAAHVQVADSVRITTAAPHGSAGVWLIDPQDFTIAAAGGDITGTALSANLGGGNVIIQSTTGATAGNGDIFVNDAVNWSANQLTLNALRNIQINANLNGSGAASLALEYGQGAANAGNAASYSLGNDAKVNLSAGNTFSTKLGSDGAVVNYTVITSLGAAGSTTTTDLQGMSGNLAGNYVLGADIDATATSAWNSNGAATPVYAGFMPLGDAATGFTGHFHGLGHSIGNLVINRPAANYVGLFGHVGTGGIVQNIGSVGGSVSGANYVGGLVGRSDGITSAISNAWASGSVSGASDVGGLVGWNNGTIGNAHATASVSGTTFVGGLIGESFNAISNVYATGNVTGGTSSIGGLVGYNGQGGGAISNAYATGSVSGTSFVGGLAGSNKGAIDNAYATGNVTGSTDNIGGLAGNNNFAGTISKAWASGSVSGRYYVGGLVGTNSSLGGIVSSNATGAVTGADSVGGLVGYNKASTVSDAWASGSVSASVQSAGGLVGWNDGSSGLGGSISNAYATGRVTSPGVTNIGGLVGYNNAGTVSNAFWDAGATGQANAIGFDDNTQTATALNGTGGAINAYTQATYTGFDFTNTWWMIDGNTRPFLRSEYSTTIRNDRQLQLVALNLAGSYTLANNLDLSGTGTAGGAWAASGFSPLGNASSNFTGAFDGLNHTITGLTINRAATHYLGLFGSTSTASVIRNVGLLNASLTGTTGALLGGLAGNNSGTISNSYVTGSVSNGSGIKVGGLVGNNAGTISSSYTTASVSSTGSNIGGLVGGNQGTISNSYATGNVSSTLGSQVGGLVGNNYLGSTISNSYSTGNVSSAGANIGGLVGFQQGTVANSFYDMDAVSVNGAKPFNANGLYTNQFTGWKNDGFTFNPVTYFGAAIAPNTYTVTGIQGLKDLLGLAGNVGLTFKLAGNIDLTATPLPAGFYLSTLAGTFDGAGNTISNFTLNNASATGKAGFFGATLAGAAIKNLGLVNVNVTSTAGAQVGGLVGNNLGAISNSYVTGSVSATAPQVGGLAGGNSGQISNSYSTATVSNTTGSQSGGLVGYNSTGAISNSYATGNVSSTGGAVGGLVGQNGSGAISNSYASGNVSGTNSVGGLIGSNGGPVSNSYATGLVTGTTDAGGLIGVNSSGTLTANFWDVTLSGKADGLGVGTNNTVAGVAGTAQAGATGLTTAQMQTQASFAPVGASAGQWDFTPNTGTWVMFEGQSNPLLRSFMTPLTITANNAAKTYDGLAYNGGAGVTYSVAPNMANLLGALSYTGTSQGATNAGSYAITPGGLISNQQGYLISFVTGTLTINPVSVHVAPAPSLNTISLNGTRVYDGTVDVAANIFTLSGLVGGQTLTLSGVGKLADKNVGVNKPVSLGTLALGNGTGSASNYTLNGGTMTATITPKALTISGSSAGDKVYDGTTAATVTAGTLAGLVGGETLNIAASGSFADKNVGTNKTVAASYVLSDGSGLAGNYSLAGENLSAAITPKALTISGSSAADKVYDGTTAASVTAGTLAGLIGGETLNIAASGNFADKNVGTNKTVAVSYILSDGSGLAGNYSLAGEYLAANITARPVTIAAVGGSDASTPAIQAAAIQTVQQVAPSKSATQAAAIQTVQQATSGTSASSTAAMGADGNGTGGSLLVSTDSAGHDPSGAIGVRVVNGGINDSAERNRREGSR
jgi:hypothetical protein